MLAGDGGDQGRFPEVFQIWFLRTPLWLHCSLSNYLQMPQGMCGGCSVNFSVLKLGKVSVFH